MIIKSLNLEHFGKFHHKSFELSDRINIIYGGNEAGKSTVHHFIQAMLFGIQRGRGKAAAKDDYTRFQPWQEGRNYEGIIYLEHEGHIYRIYRNFYKEDTAVHIFDETLGREIFTDGGTLESLIPGMTEANYKNTVSIRQLGSRIDDKFASSLQSYMANISMSKDESVDIGAAMEILTDQERQIRRRINSGGAEHIKNEMDKLDSDQSQEAKIHEQLAQAGQETEALEQQIAGLREQMTRIQNRERRERMEGRALIEQYQAKARALSEERQKNQEKEQKAKHYFLSQGGFRFFLYMTLLAVMFMGIQLFFKLDLFWMKALTGLMLASAIVGLAKTSFKKPVYRQQTQNVQAYEQAMRQISEQLSPYIKKYGKDMMAPAQFEEISQKMRTLMEQHEMLARTHEKLMLQQEHQDEQQAKLIKLREQWSYIQKQSEEDTKDLKALALAKQAIQEISGEIHQTFGTHLNEEASQIFNTIVSKHTERNFYIDEKLTIHMDGVKQQIPIERLSEGTIEQLFFALRLCAGKLIFGDQNMPLILDDTFAYYDDRRLKHMIQWLVQNHHGQLVMFTCHHREADLLEQLGYDYNYIDLESL